MPTGARSRALHPGARRSRESPTNRGLERDRARSRSRVDGLEGARVMRPRCRRRSVRGLGDDVRSAGARATRAPVTVARSATPRGSALVSRAPIRDPTRRPVSIFRGGGSVAFALGRDLGPGPTEVRHLRPSSGARTMLRARRKQTRSARFNAVYACRVSTCVCFAAGHARRGARAGSRNAGRASGASRRVFVCRCEADRGGACAIVAPTC